VKVLFLDAYNLIYRARSGFSKGDNYVIYNFFRGVRPLVEMFSPDKVYFVLEGDPKFRKELSGGEYKANRTNKDGNFHRQKAAIISMVKTCLPFTTVRHPDLECDDTIATLVSKHCKEGDECTVISSDSDFIQLLNSFKNCSLYNPVRKKFIEAPEYDYVMWKALRGDPTDNIFGIRGVGDKTATKLIKNPESLKEFLGKRDNQKIFERNVNLIRLVDFSTNMSVLESCACAGNFEKLKNILDDLEFQSMTKEKSWKKYVDTFRRL
jgi:DNA polymerase I